MSPEAIAELIRRAVREKVFAPGTPLIQEDLAQRFGVSRSPVREALRILSSEGLVLMQPGEGATVRALSRADLEEIYDLRLALEPLIARSVVAESRPRDLASLEKLEGIMSSAAGTDAWMRANFEFHRHMYGMIGRPRTEAILDGLLSAVQPYSQENIEQLGGRQTADDEHRLMIAAIRADDPEALAQLITVHLRAARDRLALAYEETEAPDPLRMLRP
ncbi:GntR family transcriptional regulator [Microbacterium panaciterrae]|uniref:GntR family transcriptional regulator n=1 Tax=Microbacterium panaciterrae TaxID=985759 RepID=A0ABP8PSU2_9MICO